MSRTNVGQSIGNYVRSYVSGSESVSYGVTAGDSTDILDTNGVTHALLGNTNRETYPVVIPA